MHASEVYSTRLEQLLPCGTSAAQNGADVELPFWAGRSAAQRHGGSSGVWWWQDAVLQQTACLAPQPSHAASADEARVRQARIAAAVLVYILCCSSLLLQATTKGRWVVEDSWSGWWCLWPGGSS